MSNINQHFKTLREKTKFKLKKKGGMAGLTLILLLLVSAIAYYLVTKSDDTDPPGTEHECLDCSDPPESPICIDCTGTPAPPPAPGQQPENSEPTCAFHGDWTVFSPCSNVCGPGTRTRQRSVSGDPDECLKMSTESGLTVTTTHLVQTEDCHVDCPCVPSWATPSDFNECACDDPNVVKIRSFDVDDVGTNGGTDCVQALTAREGFVDMGGSYSYNTYTGQIVHTMDCSGECPTDCEVGAWSTWGPECPCVDATTWWQQEQTRDIDVVTHPRNRSDSESQENCLQVVRAQADVPGSVTVLDDDTFQETRLCECTYVPCQPSDYTEATIYKKGMLFSPSFQVYGGVYSGDINTIINSVKSDYTLDLTNEQLESLFFSGTTLPVTETDTIARFSNLDTLLGNNEYVISQTSYTRKSSSVCQGEYTTEYAARTSPAAPIIRFNPNDLPYVEANVEMLVDPVHGNRNNYLGYHLDDHPAEYTLVVGGVPDSVITRDSFHRTKFFIPTIPTGTEIKVRKTVTFKGNPFHFDSNTVTV